MKCGLGIDTPAGNKLYASMKKYGIDSFSFELLEKCTSEELNENIKQKDEHLFQTLNTISKNNEMPVHYIKDCKYYSLGDSMFPDMLKALKGAKKCFFLYSSIKSLSFSA